MSELKKYQMFIDGQWVDSDTKKTFETLNPENNKPWAVVPEASANDVDKAVKMAIEASKRLFTQMKVIMSDETGISTHYPEIPPARVGLLA